MSSRGRRVGEFVRSADPAADQRQGRPLDCTSHPSQPIMRRPDRRSRREARAPCGISSRSAKGCRHEVIWTPLDTRRDREADLPGDRASQVDCRPSQWSTPPIIWLPVFMPPARAALCRPRAPSRRLQSSSASRHLPQPVSTRLIPRSGECQNPVPLVERSRSTLWHVSPHRAMLDRVP